MKSAKVWMTVVLTMHRRASSSVGVSLLLCVTIFAAAKAKGALRIVAFSV